ncbi:hypothetical protein [Azospirillum sp. sgz301742]
MSSRTHRGALLGALLLGACSAPDGVLHDALYRLGNPEGARMGLGSMAMLAPWQVHSPQACARLSTPGAALKPDSYSHMVDLCRRSDDRRGSVTVASR